MGWKGGRPEVAGQWWTRWTVGAGLTRLLFCSAINGILAMDTFKHDFSTGSVDELGKPSMTPSQVSLIVAMLSAGTAVGALLSAPIGDRWGRRLSLIFAIGVFCMGAVLQLCATNVALLVVGRCVFPVPSRTRLALALFSGQCLLTSATGR